MIRIAQKSETRGYKRYLIRLLSILVGVLLSGLAIALIGYNPFITFKTLFLGSFASSSALINTVTLAIPLCITALGLSIAFHMKFWNIGGEGQFIMGAIFATYVSHKFPAFTPDTVVNFQLGSLVFSFEMAFWGRLFLLLAMALAGFIGGALWAIIPGFFRIKFSTNETLFTLMMNYIAFHIVSYLHVVLWKDPNAQGFPKIRSIPDMAHLPKLFGVQMGWIIALILTVFIGIFIKRTKLGYEMRVVGESSPTAHYAGMNVKAVLLKGILLSGGLVGLAGMVKLSGNVFTLSPSVTGNAGFTAIIVAWLANLSAPLMVIVALFMAALEQGSQVIQISLKMPTAVAQIIQGLILLSALGGEFFLRYQIIGLPHTKKRPPKEPTPSV